MLRPIEIKGMTIENPVLLAPMAGVSDLPFRTMVLEYGAKEYRPSLAVSEMVPSNSQVVLSARTRASPRAKKMFEPRSGSVQIFGADPEIMAESARINESLGARMIDINMGCPANKIIKNDAGAALMKTPVLAAEIVRAVVAAVKVPVSVKIRTGWDDAHKNAASFARMLEAEGAAMIAIHGRTRAQAFGGKVDMESIAAVKRAVSVPVIANGDIDSPESARAMLAATGADGVMIGRAACGRPWLLSHIIRALRTGRAPPEPDRAEQKALLLRHVELLLEYYGERTGALFVRKHAAWSARGLPRAAEFRRKINAATSRGVIVSLIDEYF